MKVEREQEFLETEGLDNEQKKFEISNSRRMFEILSSNIYRDKPLAVVREYGCNAYDAHIAAGRADVPFEVHLPNSFEPWFSIKDFGTGLSHDDVLKLYTTYGLSTKSNENESIGMLGLGSKSAFAYTDQFTITSIFEGMCRSYQAFKDKDGVPTITMLSEYATDEHCGLEIYIPAKQADFSTFANRAEKIFYRFPTLPTITGNQINLTQVEYPMEGPNYKVRANNLSYYDGAFAIQGTVAYPISSRSFGEGRLNSMQRALIEDLPVDIIFPIGQLDVTASREELNYDDNTQDNLIKAINQVLEHLPGQFRGVLDHCETLWEAKKYYKEWMGQQNSYSRAMMKLLGERLTWKGEAITSDIIKTERMTFNTSKEVLIPPDPLDPNSVVQTRTVIEAWAEFTCFLAADLDLDRRAKPSYTTQPEFSINDNFLFLFADKKLRSPIRSMQRIFEPTKWARIYLITVEESRQQEVINLLGNPPTDQIDWLSNFEEPAPEPRAQKKVKDVRKCLVLKSCRESKFETRETEKDLTEGGKYLITYKSEVLHPNLPADDQNKTAAGIHYVMYLMQRSGILKGERIYVFNSSFRKLAEKNPLWINYYTEMEQKLIRMYSNQQLIKSMSYFYKLANKTDEDYQHSSRFSNYLKLVEHRKDLVSPTSKLTRPVAGINIHLNIINRILGTKLSEDDAFRASENFFTLN